MDTRFSQDQQTLRKELSEYFTNLITLNSVAPSLMVFGTQEQKQIFLPQISCGKCIFAIDYTKPGYSHAPIHTLAAMSVISRKHYGYLLQALSQTDAGGKRRLDDPCEKRLRAGFAGILRVLRGIDAKCNDL